MRIYLGLSLREYLPMNSVEQCRNWVVNIERDRWPINILLVLFLYELHAIIFLALKGLPRIEIKVALKDWGFPDKRKSM